MVELISTHIPKTAGTSFKRTLTDVYGDQLSLIYRTVHNTSDPRAIHGHFPTKRYKAKYPEAKTVVWLRNPVDRTVSHYNYWLLDPPKRISKTREYVIRNQLSLVEFAKLPNIRNVITKTYLTDMQLEEYDFVGLVEHYEDDLQELAKLLDWPKVKTYHKNASKRPYQLSTKVRDKLLTINHQDAMLFEHAKRLRFERMSRTSDARLVRNTDVA